MERFLQQDARLIKSLINGALLRHEEARVAFVLNGGTTPQACVIFKLWQEEDAAYRDAFDVQRDTIVQLKELI